MNTKFAFLVMALILGGCSAGEAPHADKTTGDSEMPQATDSATEKSADKPGGVIPQYQLDAMEKAKKVEGELQDAADKRAAEIDDQ
ncbi:hypothetical protein [Microbulbifer sp. SAOS-129_SWC]|uniref:hypothetical protein n=1 Tax=Microbulbifer sp. SAOS-129_SWC TaxID=3145235 RepID=UPI003217CD8A